MTKPLKQNLTFFAAGLVMGLALMFQIPRMLDVQREYYHHPDYTQGALVKTDHPLDLAIYGRGYFQFAMPNGNIGYSRLSEFRLDNTGNLVSKHGYLVEPNIQIPADYLSYIIGPEGIVVATQPGSQENQLGTVQIAVFINPDGLQPTSEGYFLETEESGPPQIGNPGQGGWGVLLQGYSLLSTVPEGTPDNLIINGPQFNGPNDRQQEKLIETGRDLDFGIDGPGFIGMTLPDGNTGYTRYAHLVLDEYGTLLRTFPGPWQGIRSGFIVEPNIQLLKTISEKRVPRLAQPRGGQVVVSPSSLSIQEATGGKPLFKGNPYTPSYTIQRTAIPDYEAIEDVAGKIQLYIFNSPENLSYFLNGVYLETERSGSPQTVEQGKNGAGVLKQGFLNDIPRFEP